MSSLLDPPDSDSLWLGGDLEPPVEIAPGAEGVGDGPDGILLSVGDKDAVSLLHAVEGILAAPGASRYGNVFLDHELCGVHCLLLSVR